MIHSFPLYIADWRDSRARRRLNDVEKLLYLELFIFCWSDGTLPQDEQELFVISGMDRRNFQKAWPRVKDEFFLQDGAYHHHKVDAGRPRLESWREGRAKGAIAANRAKSSERYTDAIACAIATPPSSSSSSSSSSSEKTPPPPLQGGAPVAVKPRRKNTYPDDFAEWFGWYPRNEDKFAASKAWAKLTAAEKTLALEGLKRQLPSMAEKARKEGYEFIPHASTWLNKRRWENGIAAPVQPVLVEALSPSTSLLDPQRDIGPSYEAELAALMAKERQAS